MKKVLSVIGLSLLLNFNVSIVKADKCEELKMYANSNFDTKSSIYMNYNRSNDTVNYNFDMYTLTENSATFSIYCRNAGVSAGKSYDGEVFYCDHKIFDATSENEEVRAYDAGIVQILKNGYSTRNPNYNTLDGYQGYVATNIALRAYEMLWKNLNTNGNNNSGLSNAHKYFVNLWLDDPEIQDLLVESVGSVRDKFDYTYSVTSFTDASGANITTQIENEARRLLILGLEGAKYYRENGAASLKGVDSKPTKLKEPVTTDGSGNKTYKMSLLYTFEADKFKSNDAYINIGFNCANCTSYGVDYTVYINDNNVGKNPQNTNIVEDYLTDGSGTIEYKIEFSGTSATYHCEQLNYELNLKYFDETISIEAYDMYSSGCKSNYSCQHFYLLYADDVPTELTIEDDIELCSLTCEELEQACDNGNGDQDACDRFQEEFGGDCAECTTYVNNMTCTKEDSEINLTEGYDVDTSACGTINEDNLNVLQCIIKQRDPSGNSYQATPEGYEGYIDNDYCKIYCKEDYHFVLPGVKAVNSGRYFSLEASINGTKTCYTSEIDENGTFESDLEEKREAVINAYNSYIFLYTMENTDFENVTDEKYKSSCTACEPTGTEGTDSYDACGAGCECISNTCKINYKKLTYTTYGYNGEENNIKDEEHRFGTYENAGCGGTGSCTNYQDDYDSRNYDEQLEVAISTLNSSIGAYIEILNKYNSCSGINTVEYDMSLNYSDATGWEMNYKYDPTITFWYEESYMNSVHTTNELETVGSTSVGGFKQSFCTSDVDKTYECSSGWKTSVDKGVTKRQFVCKESGNEYTCGPEDIIISKAKYVKQEMTSSGSYRTPTQFYTIYPTGSIVISEAGNSDNIENSKELTNLLPVGLGTRQGVYTYALRVSDLGEYYNNDKLGRLWGDSNSVVVTILEDEDSCIEEGSLKDTVKVDNTVLSNGVYVCAYKVNCPDCPVECEVDGCKNPDCPDNYCPVECDNCIYTNNETNINYRPITPGNINPNDRDQGVNWSYDDYEISTALELKAYATTQEIENDGENIYDLDFENPSVDTDIAMKVTIDSTMINKIREYNDKYENDGGYANNSLKCYDFTNTDGEVYENIYCYSTFIDELLYDNKTKDKVEIIGNRIIGTSEDDSDTLRKSNSNTQNSGYWTTWSEASSSGWTINTTNGIAYYKLNYGAIGIGPSWK